MKLLLSTISTLALAATLAVQSPSQVWNPDRGDGTYTNPVIYADYSDPDVCRVGDNFYMTASSFNCIPGLPILQSRDLVNWQLVGHAIERMPEAALWGEGPVNHGGGVWAPSIRHHAGEFYIYYGDPDIGIFMTKSPSPAGPWEPLTLVKKGKGLIDPCPLWDDNGEAYLVHAFAGSRAGIKSLLALTRLSADGRTAVGQTRIIYDGHGQDPTIEGPKFYKKDGWYWIFAPAGGVATGWQTVLRARSPFGPYERRVVLAQGGTSVNGPHQGAWVATPGGEDWFLHFQDVGTVGRIVHLQPMSWQGGWPVIGTDGDGDGLGEPVATHRKPFIRKASAKVTPADSDEFDSPTLGLQWQWQANPQPWWHFADPSRGTLRLYSVPLPEKYKSLWDVPNLLLQKLPAPHFTATVKLTLLPDERFDGERTGLVVMGSDYGVLSVEARGEGFVLAQSECIGADKGATEMTGERISLEMGTVWLRVEFSDDVCRFSYSIDGNGFRGIGLPFTAAPGMWIGAKMGLFCTRPLGGNDGGMAEVDWFRVEK